MNRNQKAGNTQKGREVRSTKRTEIFTELRMIEIDICEICSERIMKCLENEKNNKNDIDEE